MKKYVLPYGQGSKEIELDETLVLKEVRTKEFEPMKNIPYEILEAIYHPGSDALRSTRSSSRVRRLPSSAMTRRVSPTASTSCRFLSMR